MSKLKIWNENVTWSDAENEWDAGTSEAEKKIPIKNLKKLPKMVGISEEAAKHLKWKSLKYMVAHDEGNHVLKGFLTHPLKYGIRLIKSAVKSKPYSREGDFFLYGVDTLSDFEALIKENNTLLVIGFSYCHKPFECPSGRFTDDCIHDPENPICRQCFIGKAMNAIPEKNCIPLIIPTIHYIGKNIFEIVHANPDKKVIFMITACEMTLEMFGDWGNMVEIQGVGVRLDGRICNTMKAFELSEKGIKPGLTVVLDDTKEKILNFIRLRREG
ncbi:MAG: hypothetical protein VX777_06225 [Chlamydiota bacterium]|nr:hypothetical protein [Chlamydiota bacterium]